MACLAHACAGPLPVSLLSSPLSLFCRSSCTSPSMLSAHSAAFSHLSAPALILFLPRAALVRCRLDPSPQAPRTLPTMNHPVSLMPPTRGPALRLDCLCTTVDGFTCVVCGRLPGGAVCAERVRRQQQGQQAGAAASRGTGAGGAGRLGLWTGGRYAGKPKNGAVGTAAKNGKQNGEVHGWAEREKGVAQAPRHGRPVAGARRVC